ncbi:MAG: hypothetical protein KGH98_02975 [Candidatus Micrarchaeota archaeon]|nr:hypothetical protein [Candidatus Micrarchaeota archaeon]
MAKQMKGIGGQHGGISIRNYGVLGDDPTVIKAFTRLDAGGYANVALFAKWLNGKLNELDSANSMDRLEALLRLSSDEFTKGVAGDTKRGDFQMALLKALAIQMFCLDSSGPDSLDRFLGAYRQVSYIWEGVESYAISRKDGLLAEDAEIRKRKALEASLDRPMALENLRDKHLYIVPGKANEQVQRMIVELMGIVEKLLEPKLMPSTLEDNGCAGQGVSRLVTSYQMTWCKCR